MEDKKIKIALIGLGYVGLPLAVLFSSKYKVIGFDRDSIRVNELKEFYDKTNEIQKVKLKKPKNNFQITNSINDIIDCNIYIITVPTPIDKYKKPDLSYLLNATSEVGKILSKNNTVIFESTVYPGCTDEERPFLKI